MTKAKTPWMYNSGYKMPVAGSVLVEVELQDGIKDVGKAEDWNWAKCGYDIKKFRVIERLNRETNPCYEILLSELPRSLTTLESAADILMDFET